MQITFKSALVMVYVVLLSAAYTLSFPQNSWAADEPDADMSISETEDGEASESSDAMAGRSTNLPLPRFVSLRTDPINMRTGPGVRYPVDWVYARRGLPVEVVAEFDTWRRINDPDGSDGWIHTSMLSSRRTAVVAGGLRPLRRTGENEGETIAQLEPGVVVNIQRCQAGSFCRVEIYGVQGWVRRDHIWGVYPDEIIE